MKVFVDGKEVQVMNDIRVIWDGEYFDSHPNMGQEAEFSGHLQMVANYEGIILDTFEGDSIENQEKDENFWKLRGTASLMNTDLADFCH